jgi:hypothetical protein
MLLNGRPTRSFTSQAAYTPPAKSNHLQQLRARVSTAAYIVDYT